MTECKFCEEDFESDEKLHLHWMEEHKEDLNSHQKEKAKRAKRKSEEKKSQRLNNRKKLAGQVLAGGAALVLLAVLGSQLIPSSSAQQSFDLEGQPVLGSSDANVTVVEFGDYQCPYCKLFEQQIFPQLNQEYIQSGEVKFAFINYAFLGQDSTEAAIAAECVYEQDKEQFWDFHQALYDNQGAERSGWVTPELVMSIAREQTEGLDYEQLRSCVDSRATSGTVNADNQLANSKGVTGTPTVFVNGEKVDRWNDYNALKAAIEEELN